MYSYIIHRKRVCVQHMNTIIIICGELAHRNGNPPGKQQIPIFHLMLTPG